MFWYHDELNRLEEEKRELDYTPEMVFYGSSSFRLWDELPELFKEYKPINLGFGGSTLAACSWFYKKIFKGLHPTSVVIYAGDNDLGDNRHPEEVVLFFKTLLTQIREDYGNIPVTFVSIKPSPARWELSGSIHYTNGNIKEITKSDKNFYYVNIYDASLDELGKPNESFYAEDRLHLNKLGYRVWYDIISKHLKSIHKLEHS